VVYGRNSALVLQPVPHTTDKVQEDSTRNRMREAVDGNRTSNQREGHWQCSHHWKEGVQWQQRTDEQTDEGQKDKREAEAVSGQQRVGQVVAVQEEEEEEGQRHVSQ
jgi:hypothetical protein